MKSGDTIINNASVNAYIGRPDLLDYTSTKGAIVSFTRGLSNQVVGKGIRVNAVCPGPGKTTTFLPYFLALIYLLFSVPPFLPEFDTWSCISILEGKKGEREFIMLSLMLKGWKLTLRETVFLVWTPLIPATMDKEAQDQFHAVPMGRPAQPSEIATVFVFLASQDSSYISGQSLHPNGGVIVNS